MSPANWWVNTNNKVYGPYSAAQMSRFIGEGRVIATTLVADKPEGAEWTEARYVPDLRGALHEERTTFHTQRVDRRKQIASANMLVWADIVTGASTPPTCTSSWPRRWTRRSTRSRRSNVRPASTERQAAHCGR